MRKKLFSILAGMMMLVGAAVPVAAFAEGGRCSSVSFFGMDPWYATLTCTNGEVDASNFQSGRLKDTVLGIAGTVVKDLLFLAGIVAVVMIVVAGVQFITSSGDPGTVAKAKKTISGAITGLIITMLAYAIVTTVLSLTTGGTGH